MGCDGIGIGMDHIYKTEYQVYTFSSLIQQMSSNQSSHIRRYAHRDIKNNHIQRTSCPICISEFNGHDVVSCLKCDHIYHYSCIYQWMCKCFNESREIHCPLCRTNIENCSCCIGMTENVFFNDNSDTSSDSEEIDEEIDETSEESNDESNRETNEETNEETNNTSSDEFNDTSSDEDNTTIIFYIINNYI
jgi:hypothetical protein